MTCAEGIATRQPGQLICDDYAGEDLPYNLSRSGLRDFAFGYSARTVNAIPPRAENCAVTILTGSTFAVGDEKGDKRLGFQFHSVKRLLDLSHLEVVFLSSKRYN
jgi:hypothetical protein